MKKRREYFILIIPILYAIIAVVIVGVVMKNGLYPEGSDTMYHVYRGDYVYRALKEGNWYPLFAKEWYNGVELLRYWAPLPAYFMAFCLFLASGDVLNGYLIFVGLIFFLGAMSWLWIGWKKKRICLGAFIGVLWFFMPNNLLAMFIEGNLARCVCMIFLPLFIHAIETYFETKKVAQIIAISILFALMTMCHLGYAGMIALALVPYLVIHRITYGARRGERHVLAGILFGFGLVGVWMVPSLFGGMTSLDNSENMANFFQSALITLNPLARYHSGPATFYFGLTALVIAIVGIFVTDRKSRVGFITAVLIFLGTTESAYYILKVLPGSQYLWMLRFISIALCMILYSILCWKRLKRYILCVILALFVMDVIPSLPLLYGNGDGRAVEARLDEMQEYTRIAEGLQLTEQRMALMDVSTLEATGAFLVTGWNERRDATFGAGWEAAATATNIRNLNSALENGYFNYVFDRCKELGNDTVVVRLSCLPQKEGMHEALELAADLNGYASISKQGDYQLFHLENASGNWGVKSKYEGIAIGDDKYHIAVQFPAIEEGNSSNLNDYTFEELLTYDTIYLGAFSYDDKAKAEDMILRLSEAGVKIVISADGIPEDRESHSQSFLGARCEKIAFHNGYPELIIHDELINPDLFPPGYVDWETVYTEGLDVVEGYLLENELYVPFMGTVKNDNIHVFGLRLGQFCSLTGDETMVAALGELLGFTKEILPHRELIPLELDYNQNSLTITSPEDDVNTTISYHSIFRTEREIENVNNLLVVQAGTTEIDFVCREMPYGLMLSIGTVILMVVYVCAYGKERKKTYISEFMLKALITEADSELAAEVLKELKRQKFIGETLPYTELDFTDADRLEELIAGGGWDVVIHCAGFMQVGKNHQDKMLYTEEYVAGTEIITDICNSHNIPIIIGLSEGSKVKLPATAKRIADGLMERI